ncbi:unnamed protein product [Parajaminaea phylloscopi]
MSSTPEAAFMGDSGDEYEETVRRQRAENAALLKELNLQAGGSSIVDPNGARTRKLDAAAEERKRKRAADSRAKASAERKKRKAVEQAAGPQRTSARLAGRTPAGLEEENRRIEEERQEYEQKREEARRVLHDDHDLIALLGGDGTGAEDSAIRKRAEKLRAALSEAPAMAKTDSKPLRARSGLGDDADEGQDEAKDIQELRQSLDQMQLLAVKKVTPKRIYTAAFHPSVDKDMIFTGDKEGNVGMWLPLAPRASSGDDEDDDDQVTAIEANGLTGDDGYSENLRLPHDSSPVSCLKVPPSESHKLYYSSYNSTIRSVDLQKGVSEQIFSFAAGQDDDDAGALLSVFDFQRGAEDGKVVWCGDHRGGVIRIDTREPSSGGDSTRSLRTVTKSKGPSNWQRWQLCEKKIGGLSLNPAEPHALAVASLDQSVRIFDIRRLSAGIDPIAMIPSNYKAVDPDLLSHVQSTLDEGGAQLGWRQSRQASTSVDFAPDGRHLAAVSYDNVVKVWRLDRGWLREGEDVGAVAGDRPGRPRKSNQRNGSIPVKPERKGGLMKYFKKEEAQEQDTALASAIPEDILSSPLEIPHNNQTGKWLTLLRARWCAVPDLAPHFTIGSMSRSAEIWSADGKLLRSLYDEEHVSAVPAVTNMHPVREARLVTGNGSGKCTFWGIRDRD